MTAKTTARDHQRHHGWTMLAPVLWLLWGAGCATDPANGTVLCRLGPNTCPTGYYCAGDLHCWRESSGAPASSDLAGGEAMAPDDAGSSSPDLASTQPTADMGSAPSDMTVAFDYCPAGTLFCDNFENDTLALNMAGNWSSTFVLPVNGTQTLATGTTQRHDGTHALHAASSMGVDSWSAAVYTLGTPATALTLRLFVFPNVALANLGEVVRVMNTNTTDGFQIGAAQNGNKWSISENLGSVGHDSTTTITAGAWSCIELVIPSFGNVQLYINGAPTPALSFSPQRREAYDTLHAGVEWAPAGVPVDVWIDEVAVGTGRLLCPTS